MLSNLPPFQRHPILMYDVSRAPDCDIGIQSEVKVNAHAGHKGGHVGAQKHQRCRNLLRLRNFRRVDHNAIDQILFRELHSIHCPAKHFRQRRKSVIDGLLLPQVYLDKLLDSLNLHRTAAQCMHPCAELNQHFCCRLTHAGRRAGYNVNLIPLAQKVLHNYALLLFNLSTVKQT